MSVAEFLAPDLWLSPDAGPRYIQLRKRLSDGVEQGILKPGSSLPPEREIAALTELSRVTVRKAIQALAEDGVIVQKQGYGSFIASQTQQIEQSLSRLTSFSEDMSRRGMVPASRWLESGIFMPSPDEVIALALTRMPRCPEFPVSGWRTKNLWRSSVRRCLPRFCPIRRLS
jgi:GntR family transcriptional regulator